MPATFSVIAKTKNLSVFDPKVDFREYKVWAESLEDAQSKAEKRAEAYNMNVCVLEIDRLKFESRDGALKRLAA
jgi:hypothetical protein